MQLEGGIVVTESPSADAIGDQMRADHEVVSNVRRFELVSLVAVLAAAVPYLWVAWDLWGRSLDPLRVNGPGSVYDVQARAILHGHLSLPRGSIGLEAFIRNGRAYTYFGVFPSLIRIPVLLVTHSLDGRLTALSIVASWFVTAAFASLLLWRIRVIVREDAPLGWAEALSYGTLLASILVGSVLIFLASEPVMYSEDLAWSVALCSGSLFALLGVAERPSSRRVALAGLLILCTNLNRATTGYACVITAVLLASWFALGRAGPERRRWALPVLSAGLVPLIVGCTVDLVKFNLFFGVPASEQLLYRAFNFGLVNGGHYFSLRFLPSTLQAYLSPGNLGVTSVFPFLTLPDVPTHAVAHTTLFAREPSASLTASMPLLFATGLVGVVAVLLPGRRAPVRALRILLVGTAVAAGAVAIFGWILERFLADFMPFLLLAATIGMVDLWRRLHGRRRAARILAAGGIGVLAAFGFVANLGIAVVPNGDWTPVQLQHYVQAQQTISDHTGDPIAGRVVQGEGFPARFSMGDLFIMGDCRALYVAEKATPTEFYLPDSVWLPVERAPHTPLCHSLLPGARREG